MFTTERILKDESGAFARAALAATPSQTLSDASAMIAWTRGFATDLRLGSRIGTCVPGLQGLQRTIYPFAEPEPRVGAECFAERCALPSRFARNEVRLDPLGDDPRVHEVRLADGSVVSLRSRLAMYTMMSGIALTVAANATLERTAPTIAVHPRADVELDGWLTEVGRHLLRSEWATFSDALGMEGRQRSMLRDLIEALWMPHQAIAHAVVLRRALFRGTCMWNLAPAQRGLISELRRVAHYQFACSAYTAAQGKDLLAQSLRSLGDTDFDARAILARFFAEFTTFNGSDSSVEETPAVHLERDGVRMCLPEGFAPGRYQVTVQFKENTLRVPFEDGFWAGYALAVFEGLSEVHMK